MARQFFFAESTEPSSHTGSVGWVDKAALTITPDASSDYLILSSALLSGNNSNVERGPRARTYHETAGVELNLLNSRLSMTQENESHAGLRRYQSPASPAAQTFKVQFGNANAADTATISDAVLFAVKMDPADQYAESLNLSSTTSATYLDKVTLSFTPASAGDYLLLAVADISGGNADATKVRLFDGTTSFGEETPHIKEANKYMQWAVAIQRPLTGAQTWKIQFASTDGSKTAMIQNAVIAALRLDAGFAAHYYAEDLTETSTTSTSPVDKLSLFATLAAQDHLVISCGHLTNANGFHTVNAFTEEDGTNFLVRDGKASTQATSTIKQWWALEKRTSTNAQHSYKTRFYVQKSGTGRFRGASLSLLQLSEAGGGALALEGAALVMASAAGVLSTAIPLTAASAGIALAGGDLLTQVTLGAAAIGAARATAGLDTAIALDLPAAGAALAGGELTVQIRLSAQALAQALAQAEFQDTALAGMAAGAALAAGALSTQLPVTGVAVSAATSDGVLTTGLPLSAVAASAAKGDGALTVALTFGAEAAARVLAAANLTTEIRLEAQAVAAALAAGMLSSQAYHADPRYTITARGRRWSVAARGRTWRIAS